MNDKERGLEREEVLTGGGGGGGHKGDCFLERHPVDLVVGIGGDGTSTNEWFKL
jgi:hypothetical protein